MPILQRSDDDAFGKAEHIALACSRQKYPRVEQALRRMASAYEALCSDQPLGFQLDLGLVEQLEPATVENVGQPHGAIPDLRRLTSPQKQTS